MGKETLSVRVQNLRALFKQETQDEFAKGVGVIKYAIAKIESGRTKSLRTKTAQGIANHCGTTIDFVVNGSDDDWRWEADTQRLLPPESAMAQ